MKLETIVLGLGLIAGFAAADIESDVVMGDWQGTQKTDGKDKPIVAQVIALGDGNYQAKILPEFDKRVPPLAVLNGKMDGAAVKFSDGPGRWQAAINGKVFSGSATGEVTIAFEMKKVERLSPTLGKKPPEKAVVLFDGTSLDAWKHPNGKECGWKRVGEAMEVTPKTGSIISKKAFANHQVHVEFRTPFMPKARGQGRGNSGVYLQGRYEVQVLDSYGLEGHDNECGGIYKISKPAVNMCAPPLQWQTYDITFHAPVFDADGKKTRNARVTVLHNGVEVQKDVEIPDATTASHGGGAREPGGLYLQDHGNPVQYRNIWVVELP